MSIQSAKDFRRRLCKILGHQDQGFGTRCPRCKKFLGLRCWEIQGWTIYNSTGVRKIILKDE